MKNLPSLTVKNNISSLKFLLRTDMCDRNICVSAKTIKELQEKNKFKLKIRLPEIEFLISQQNAIIIVP